MNIYIYGAGGAGRELIIISENMQKHGNSIVIEGFIDDNSADLPVRLLGRPVLSFEKFMKLKNRNIAISVADPESRALLVKKLSDVQVELVSLIDPSVYIHPSAYIGSGAIICMNTIISTNVNIGDYPYINFNCVIPHDTVIGNYVSLMNNVVISGNVTIEDNVFIGSNAFIKQNIRIGRNSIIGAGSVVLKDVPPCSTVAGNPAKQIS